MNDKINIAASGNSGDIIGKNTGTATVSNQRLEIKENIVRLENSYIENTEKKAIAYFAWIKRVLTIAAGAIVFVSAMYKDFFKTSFTCCLCLMAALVFLILTIYNALLSLIGEPSFYDTKCRNDLGDLENQASSPTQPVKTRHHPYVRPQYEKLATRSIFCFSMAMLSLVLYIIGVFIFNILQKLRGDQLSVEIFILSVLVPTYWLSWNYVSQQIRLMRFKWSSINYYRLALTRVKQMVRELKEKQQ